LCAQTNPDLIYFKILL